MTPDQEDQFKRFGCIPRCVVELAKRRGIRLSWHQFCANFDSHFRNRESQYGLLDPEKLPPVLRGLSLPYNIQREWDYAKVEKAFNVHGALVLVLSDIDLTPGKTSNCWHCSVLNEISSRAFRLWTPFSTGADGILPEFPATYWGEKQCSGLILS